MKKIIKQFLLVIAFIVTFITMSGVEAQAAAKPKFESKKVSTFFFKKASDLIELKNIKKNAKVTVKSSNPTVATATYFNYLESDADTVWFDENDDIIFYGVKLKVKKPGNTTITCTVEQGGKTYKLSCIYKVKKYKNPISSFKIGSANCASEFKKTDWSDGSAKLEKVIEEMAEECKECDEYGFEEVNLDKFEKLLEERKATIKIKPKKGYKVKAIWLIADFGVEEKDMNVKNGSKHSYSTLLKYGSIHVELEDKEGCSISLEMMLPEEEAFW